MLFFYRVSNENVSSEYLSGNGHEEAPDMTGKGLQAGLEKWRGQCDEEGTGDPETHLKAFPCCARSLFMTFNKKHVKNGGGLKIGC